MAFYGVDSAKAPGVADDSPVGGSVVQLAANLAAIVADRPLMAAATWRTAQRWHAPFPVYHGPFWAGYTDEPLDSITVTISHDGRVSSTGESNPSSGVQAVHIWATAVTPDARPLPPPRDLADWATSVAGAEIDETTGATIELTVDGRSLRGWVGVVIWVQSEVDTTASHTLTIFNTDANLNLLTDLATTPTLDGLAPERAALIRPSYSDSKFFADATGPVYWAEYITADANSGQLSVLVLSPPAPPGVWDAYSGSAEVDLYPMGVLQLESVVVQATTIYRGPSESLYAPEQPTYAQGPRRVANWLSGRWAKYFWALQAQSGADGGAAPWGPRLDLTTSYQAMPGDGAVSIGLGPTAIRYRALVQCVGLRNTDVGGFGVDDAAEVEARLVCHVMPPATADADGGDNPVVLPVPSLTPTGVAFQPIRHALEGELRWGAWSSRGALWPASADRNPRSDWNELTWMQLEVDSGTTEQPRVIRPEIRAKESRGAGNHVYWVGGCIAYRHEVEEDEVYIPSGGDEYGWQVTNGGRPANAMGTSITPGANDSKGSWTQILTALAEDVYRVRLVINSGDVSGQARPMLIDIGTDEAGGSSYSVVIPNLIGACASDAIINAGGEGGIAYDFALRIPAGATVAARAQVGNATANVVYVLIEGYGRPRDPRAARAGDTVTAYGVTTASSDGTSVTPGTTSEGAWTEIGTVGSEEPWGWQIMASVDNAAMAIYAYAVDLGIGQSGSEAVVIFDQWVHSGGAEAIASCGHRMASYQAQNGDKVYARAQCSGAGDSGFTIAAWGVSGP